MQRVLIKKKECYMLITPKNYSPPSLLMTFDKLEDKNHRRQPSIKDILWYSLQFFDILGGGYLPRLFRKITFARGIFSQRGCTKMWHCSNVLYVLYVVYVYVQKTRRCHQTSYDSASLHLTAQKDFRSNYTAAAFCRKKLMIF